MVKLYLLTDIKGMGLKGTIVEASDGHAHNFLIPQKKAKIATSGDIEKAKSLTQKIEANKQKKLDFIDNLKEMSKSGEPILSISGKASNGKLFAGIHAPTIAELLKAKFGVELNPKKNITLDDHLKAIGNHTVKISYNGKETDIIVEITQE